MAAVLALLGGLCACGGTVDDVTRGTPLGWRIVPDLSIGGIDTPDYTLTEVIALTVGPDGAIYVAQWNEPAVQVFDREGRFAFTIGRRGGGPGEFGQPAGLGWVGDTLWVVDMPIGRVALFGRNGEFLSSFNLTAPPISNHYSGLAPVALLSDGSVVSRPVLSSHLISAGIVDSIPLFRSDRPLEQLDTLAWLAVENSQLEIELPSGWLYTIQPISDAQLYDPYPNGMGLIVVDRSVPAKGGSDRYRVIRLGVAGDTVFVKSIPYDPVALSQQFTDSMVEHLASRLGPHVPGTADEAIRGAMFLPEIRPPVESLVAGRDGTIWLQVASARTDSCTWNVLGPTGESIGAVTAPVGLRLFEAQRDLLWGVVRDSLDVNYIVRYSVVRD